MRVREGGSLRTREGPRSNIAIDWKIKTIKTTNLLEIFFLMKGIDQHVSKEPIARTD